MRRRLLSNSDFLKNPLLISVAGALFLASLIVILVLALLPDSGAEPLFSGQDKVAHGIAFCWLFISGRLGLSRYLSVMPLVVLLAGYGALIEALQYLGGYRCAELLDFVADLAGIGLGFALMVGLKVSD